MNPLFAEVGDIIGLLITLAIIGFSVVSQLLGSGEKTKQQARRRQQQQQRAQQRAQQQAQPGNPNQPQAKTIESEIEDFLRQARGETPKQVEPLVEAVVEPEEAVRTLVHEGQRNTSVGPVEPGKEFAQELSAHVEQHVGHNSISNRDAHLAFATEAADERIEEHLENVFDHQVGHIAHYDETENSNAIAQGTDEISWEEQPEKKSAASDIVDLLRSPDNIKKMFVVSEIFKRPDI